MKAIYLFLAICLLFTVPVAFSQDGECGFTKSLIDRAYLGKTVEPRPVLSNEQIINTSHFKIHYTLQGIDATTQAWAESTASYAEYCWNFFSIANWAAPPPDNNMGGDNNYDIYILKTPVGFHGACYTEYQYTSPYPDGWTSWIEIRQDSLPKPLSKWDGLRSLISHELSHAVQAITFPLLKWNIPLKAGAENTKGVDNYEQSRKNEC